jgi:seryl-tRNA(Sec) selenium transferase
MDYDSEFSQKSSAELNSCLFKYAEEHEIHTRAVAELSKREKEADDRISAQFSKAIFWSRLAAILALPSALYLFWKLMRSL